MIVEELPIDPAGVWSPRQAAHVMRVLNPLVRPRGYLFRALDITTHEMPARRMILVAFCLRHDIAIARNSLCRICAVTNYADSTATNYTHPRH